MDLNKTIAKIEEDADRGKLCFLSLERPAAF